MRVVEVKIGQTWRRRDPTGSFEDFEVVGFQRGSFGSPATVARGRTASGKRIKASVHQMLRDEARFSLLSEDNVAVRAAEPAPPTTKKKRRPSSSWRYPAGTPIFLRLDDGSTVATVTRSLAYDLAGGRGVVKTAHPGGPWCLLRVRLDQSRRLGALTVSVLRRVCAATATGGIYTHANASEYRTLTRPKVRALLERVGTTGWRATRSGFEMLGLEPGSEPPMASAEARKAS